MVHNDGHASKGSDLLLPALEGSLPAFAEGVGTPKAQDKCALLNGDAKRDCLINDNAGG